MNTADIKRLAFTVLFSLFILIAGMKTLPLQAFSFGKSRSSFRQQGLKKLDSFITAYETRMVTIDSYEKCKKEEEGASCKVLRDLVQEADDNLKKEAQALKEWVSLFEK